MAKVPGTAGYASEAQKLFGEYEAQTFEKVHSQIVHLFPAVPAYVLDIGAGTGRDAAGFAALGYKIVAVEPVDEFRLGAARSHPHPNITWIDDGLPELKSLAEHVEQFDLVMMTAVLMHIDAEARAQAISAIVPLMRSGGLLVMMLRYGPVPQGRTMFDVQSDEIVAVARPLGLTPVLDIDHASANPSKTGVTWTRLALRKA